MRRRCAYFADDMRFLFRCTKSATKGSEFCKKHQPAGQIRTVERNCGCSTGEDECCSECHGTGHVAVPVISLRNPR